MATRVQGFSVFRVGTLASMLNDILAEIEQEGGTVVSVQFAAMASGTDRTGMSSGGEWGALIDYEEAASGGGFGA